MGFRVLLGKFVIVYLITIMQVRTSLAIAFSIWSLTLFVEAEALWDSSTWQYLCICSLQVLHVPEEINCKHSVYTRLGIRDNVYLRYKDPLGLRDLTPNGPFCEGVRDREVKGSELQPIQPKEA